MFGFRVMNSVLKSVKRVNSSIAPKVDQTILTLSAWVAVLRAGSPSAAALPATERTNDLRLRREAAKSGNAIRLLILCSLPSDDPPRRKQHVRGAAATSP